MNLLATLSTDIQSILYWIIAAPDPPWDYIAVQITKLKLKQPNLG